MLHAVHATGMPAATQTLQGFAHQNQKGHMGLLSCQSALGSTNWEGWYWKTWKTIGTHVTVYLKWIEVTGLCLMIHSSWWLKIVAKQIVNIWICGDKLVCCSQLSLYVRSKDCLSSKAWYHATSLVVKRSLCGIPLDLRTWTHHEIGGIF